MLCCAALWSAVLYGKPVSILYVKKRSLNVINQHQLKLSPSTLFRSKSQEPVGVDTTLSLSPFLVSNCCTVLCCNVQYCTVLYCTVLYCTVLYCTVLNFSKMEICSCSTYFVNILVFFFSIETVFLYLLNSFIFVLYSSLAYNHYLSDFQVRVGRYPAKLYRLYHKNRIHSLLCCPSFSFFPS